MPNFKKFTTKKLNFLFSDSGIVEEQKESSLISLQIEPLNVAFSIQPNNLPAINALTENDYDDENSKLVISSSLSQVDSNRNNFDAENSMIDECT